MLRLLLQATIQAEMAKVTQKHEREFSLPLELLVVVVDQKIFSSIGVGSARGIGEREHRSNTRAP